MNKIIYRLAAVVSSLLFTGTIVFSQTAVQPTGNGSTIPYQIDSLANLYWITQNSSSWSSSFVQTADIDASSDSSWNSGAGFKPISGFTGSYDGNGYSISGLFISLSGGSNAGLFSTASGATIKKLKLTNVRVTVTGGGGYVGGLVGDAQTTVIDSCFVSGTVIGAGNSVGGLVGSSTNNSGPSNITNSSTSANVKGGPQTEVGGLVGDNNASDITACFSTGSVTDSLSNADIGGLVGNSENGSLVDNSYSSGIVTGSGSVQQLGGLVGVLSASTLENCSASGSVHGHDQSIGGLVGYVTGVTSPSTVQATITGCHSTATVVGDSDFVGGLVGNLSNESSLTNSYSGRAVTGADQYVGGLVGYAYQVTAIRNCYSTATVSGGTYVGGLIGYGYGINTGSSTVDSSYASGTVNGGSDVGGFIGVSSETAITNSHSAGSVFASGGGSGGFAGDITGISTVTDCYSAGSDSGANTAGGFTGESDDYVTISGCYSTGKVQGATYVGGFVGYTTGSAGMNNCYSMDTVVASGSYVGGLVGDDTGAGVDKCYSTGSVTGGSSVGGLVGGNIGNTTNSFWDTQTSGQSSSSYGDMAETTTQMQTQSTFTNNGWDFSSTWAIDPSINGGFPGLTWQSQYVASAPAALTNSATGVNWALAGLHGTVSPYKGTTTVKFIYGTSSGNYPDTVNAAQSPVSGWGAVSVSANISSLTASTTYYYRVIATNPYGSSEGSEVTFSTIAAPAITSVPGDALKFNANSNQFVSVPDNVSLELADSLTFEAWVYPTGSGNMTVIDKGNDNCLFEIKPNGNPGLGFYNGNTNWIYTTQAVPDSQWSFIAVTFKSGTLSFYLDGTLLTAAATSSSLATSTGPFAIGQQGPGGTCDCNYFYGDIDEVRVWDVSRTEPEIRSDMYKTLTGTETGLVAYWQFNEGGGDTTYDVVGGNEGVLTNYSGSGTPTWVTSDAPVGKYGTFDSTATADSAGRAGSTVAVTLTSPVDSTDNVGLYSYGSPTDTAVTDESFPAGVDKRSPVIWGVFAVGNDTANVTLNYSGQPGIQNSGGLYVLEREEADSPWVDVTSKFTQSLTGNTFTENAVSSFNQFAIGAGTDNSLPVQATDFVATSGAGSVTLSWKTHSEENNAGFNVLRRQSGIGDWQLIGSCTSDDSLRGLGTSSTGKAYDFTDDKVTSGDTYSYKIQSVSTSGTTKDLSTLTVTIDVPKIYALYQNYPNPFNPSTTIRFDLKEQANVVLGIYNVLGQRVLEESYGNLSAGRYNEDVTMSRFASGVYFYRIVAVGNDGQKFMALKKLMLVK